MEVIANLGTWLVQSCVVLLKILRCATKLCLDSVSCLLLVYYMILLLELLFELLGPPNFSVKTLRDAHQVKVLRRCDRCNCSPPSPIQPRREETVGIEGKGLYSERGRGRVSLSLMDGAVTSVCWGGKRRRGKERGLYRTPEITREGKISTSIAKTFQSPDLIPQCCLRKRETWDFQVTIVIYWLAIYSSILIPLH